MRRKRQVFTSSGRAMPVRSFPRGCPRNCPTVHLQNHCCCCWDGWSCWWCHQRWRLRSEAGCWGQETETRPRWSHWAVCSGTDLRCGCWSSWARGPYHSDIGHRWSYSWWGCPCWHDQGSLLWQKDRRPCCSIPSSALAGWPAHAWWSASSSSSSCPTPTTMWRLCHRGHSHWTVEAGSGQTDSEKTGLMAKQTGFGNYLTGRQTVSGIDLDTGSVQAAVQFGQTVVHFGQIVVHCW